MADVKTRILSIIKRPQLCALATVTGDGKPWVRYVMTVGADDFTLRCVTFISARKVGQIERVPEVHLTCGVTDPRKMAPYLQIQARAVLDTSTEERNAHWSPMLKQIFDGPDDPRYGVLVIKPYRIEHCTPGSYAPDVWEAGQ